MHGSFSADGTFKPYDSLPLCGALGSNGSLSLYGTLRFDGSLHCSETLKRSGSLLDVGTLDYDGSLDDHGTLFDNGSIFFLVTVWLDVSLSGAGYCLRAWFIVASWNSSVI